MSKNVVIFVVTVIIVENMEGTYCNSRRTTASSLEVGFKLV